MTSICRMNTSNRLLRVRRQVEFPHRQMGCIPVLHPHQVHFGLHMAVTGVALAANVADGRVLCRGGSDRAVVAGKVCAGYCGSSVADVMFVLEHHCDAAVGVRGRRRRLPENRALARGVDRGGGLFQGGEIAGRAERDQCACHGREQQGDHHCGYGLQLAGVLVERHANRRSEFCLVAG